MITVPVSTQMYQTMVANIQQLPNGDGTVCITPMQVHNQNQTVNLNNRTTPNTQNLTISTSSNVSYNSLLPNNGSINLNQLKKPRNVQSIANASVANLQSISQRNQIDEHHLLNQLLANQSKKINVIANNNNSNNNNNNVKISLSKETSDGNDKVCQKSSPVLPQGIVIQLNGNILNNKDLLSDNLSAVIEKQIQLVKQEREEAQLRSQNKTSSSSSPQQRDDDNSCSPPTPSEIVTKMEEDDNDEEEDL